MGEEEFTDAEQHAQRLRRNFGLPAAIAHIRAVAAQAGDEPSPLGIPLSPAEAADILARDAISETIAAITERLEARPHAWAAHAGVWIDQASGGVLHVLTTPGYPASDLKALCARAVVVVRAHHHPVDGVVGVPVRQPPSSRWTFCTHPEPRSVRKVHLGDHRAGGGIP